MNGFRIVLTLKNASSAFQMDEGTAAGKTVVYSINDPTIYTNIIRVHPAVDRGIIDASRVRMDVFVFTPTAAEATR